MADPLPLEILKSLWAAGNQHVPGLLEGISAAAADVFEKYSIGDVRTVAIIMGEFSEESGCGLEMTENMNYTAQRLRQVFPSHFTVSLAAKAAHNPEMIGEIAYGGRMGNAPPPSPDGYNYRGRGLSQVTGKEGYADLQKELDRLEAGIDILTNPDLVCDPKYALLCGVADFVLCKCLPYAKEGNIIATSAMLNVGHLAPAREINGLAAREQWIAKWTKALHA
jgi:putative chitinase